MRVFIAFFVMVCLIGCQQINRSEDEYTLHIIHAGSLTLPVHEISKAFQEENPDVRILTEAWGSKAGARRVIDVNTPADVFMSADYLVIENMLIPEHASWYLPFATNELSIVYTSRSRYAGEINQDNWMDILMKPDVKYGRSNPDMDPCGVRSALAIKLAEKKYGKEEFARKLLEKDTDNIRPKETDLIALLEKNHIDYIFLYKSVAVQHGLEYLKLPDSLSLGNFELNDWYRNVNIETLGTRPGETITEYGEAMVYGLTIPHKSENPELAEKFIRFVLHPDKGQAILKRLGQDPVMNFDNPFKKNIPEELLDQI
ncbi:MAG: extracellular solute-binding protein [Bacteroidales bacterium]